MGVSRRAFLRERVKEYLEQGIGADHWQELLEKMLSEGDTTFEEMGREYGPDGFHRNIIRPVTRKLDGRGVQEFLPTKSGGYKQTDFADLSDCIWVYYTRKHHNERVVHRLERFRQYIIDRHGVDPEEVDDPMAYAAEDESV